MRSHFLFLSTICIIAVTTRAQDGQAPSINLGDPAPPLQVREWLKDTPIQKFEKGRVYVLEFWATYCKGCIAAMPHLSSLAREYRDNVSFIGIDIYENKNTSIEKVKAFVDSMGRKMDYHVAAVDNNLMETGWMEPTGEKGNGIPNTFVVDAEGRLAWIGHPIELDEVLRKIVNNTWDVKEALANRNEQKRLKYLDEEARFTLMTYYPDQFRPAYPGNPDSGLLAINEIVRNEPKLKYAFFIADNTFTFLLMTNPHKAYEYGKAMLAKQSFLDPRYESIIGTIEFYSEKLIIPAEIYELGADACQTKIDLYGESGTINIAKAYNKMADMFWRAKNKLKAIEAQQKAIESLKSIKNFSKKDMAYYESRIQQYKSR